MMKRALAILGVAAMILGFGAVPALATTVQHSMHEGYFADAIFRSEQGSIVTDMNVGLFGGNMKGQLVDDNGEFVPIEVQAPAAGLFFTINDYDTGQVLLNAYAVQTIPKTDFGVDPQLRWAWLKTTVTATDVVSGESFPVSVDVTWAASGRFVKFGGPSIVRWTDDRIGHDVIHQNGRMRANFDSAIGTVTMGSTNLTPEPASSGWIMRETYFLSRATK